MIPQAIAISIAEGIHYLNRLSRAFQVVPTLPLKDKLQAAFDNVFATMDAVDTFRAQAVDSMAQTVHALEGQIERAKPYLERTRRGEQTG